jgi:hypothetical protein
MVTVKVTFLAEQPSKATCAERVTACRDGVGGVVGAGGTVGVGGTTGEGAVGAGRFGNGLEGVVGVGSGFVRGGSVAGGATNGGPARSAGSVTFPSITMRYAPGGKAGAKRRLIPDPGEGLHVPVVVMVCRAPSGGPRMTGQPIANWGNTRAPRLFSTTTDNSPHGPNRPAVGLTGLVGTFTPFA